MLSPGSHQVWTVGADHGLRWLSLSTARALEVGRGAHEGSPSRTPSQEGPLSKWSDYHRNTTSRGPLGDISQLRDDPEQPSLKQNLHLAESPPQAKGLLGVPGSRGRRGHRALICTYLQEVVPSSNSCSRTSEFLIARGEKDTPSHRLFSDSSGSRAGRGTSRKSSIPVGGEEETFPGREQHKKVTGVRG